MSKVQIVGGIDIGSYAVKTLIVKHEEGKKPKIIGLGSHSADGFRAGEVKDMEYAIKSVSASVKEAQEMAGLNLNKFFVAINGRHLKSRLARGFVSVSRADQEISDSDIQRVTNIQSLNASQPNREIIHAIPLNFIIDGQEIVKNPLGMKGFKLEAEVLIIDGLTPYLKNIENVLSNCGFDVIEFTYAPLAASFAVLDKKEKEYGSLVLDFGSELSTLSLFEEGSMYYTATIPLGSWFITHDINIALKIPVEQAEAVKLTYGYIDSKGEKGYKRDQLDLTNIIGRDEFNVSRKKLGDIISSRVNEWLGLILRDFTNIRRKSNNSNLTIAVLIGGGVNLKGVENLIKDKLSLPTRIGSPTIDSVVEESEDPAFAVCAGLCLWALERGEDYSGSGSIDLSFLRGATKWFKNFIP